MSGANWSNPTLSSTYTNVITNFKDRDEDSAMMFDVGSPTNVPTDAIKFAKSAGVFQKWTGSAWSTVTLLSAAIAANAITTSLILDANVTAAKLASGAAASNLGFTPANKAGDTFTGSVSISSTAPNLEFVETDASNKKYGFNVNTSAFMIYEDTTASPRLTIAAGAGVLALGAASVLTYGGSTIWTAANDGAGSGLDADTTDGQHLATSNTPQFAGLGLGAAWDSAGIWNVTATGMTSNVVRRAAQINADNTTATLSANRIHHGMLVAFLNKHTDASGFFVSLTGIEAQASSGGVGVSAKATDLIGLAATAQNLTDQATNNLVVNGFGVKSVLKSNHANALMTTGYGVSSEINAASAGAITTAYLFYGAYTGTAPTNNRGIRLVAEGYSQFDGSLGLGITPTQKLHVSGNSIITGTMTAGTQVFGGGSQAASAPDFSFTGDTNTGMRRTGTDILALVTNSADRLTIDAAGLVGINQAPATYQLGITGTFNATTLYENGTLLSATYVKTSVANTYTLVQTVSLGAVVTTALNLISTDAGAADWPAFVIDRQSTTPAAADVIASIAFQGKNSGATSKIYAALQASIVDAAAATEDGQLSFRTMVAGTDAVRAYVAQGMVVGTPTGTDKGVGSINASTIYWNGTSLAGKFTMPLPYGSWRGRATNPAGVTTFETATNKVQAVGWAFDPVTSEYIQCSFPMPKSWDKGTIDLTIRGVRHTGTGTSAARFLARALIVDSGDATDIAFGTEIGVTITPNTTADIKFEGAITGITAAGTTSNANSSLVLQLRRNPADAADTDGTNDFIIEEAFLTFTTSAPTDN